MPAQIPTEEEVLGYFSKLSNWGRWGPDDELGTPNLITPEKTKRGIATVQEGTTVSLARDILWDATADVPNPPVHFMVESGEGWASGDKVSGRPNAAATDYIGMIFHGYAVTHVDSLAHFFWEGKTYNGKPAHMVSTNLGATVCSVVAAKKGFTSRGVLVGRAHDSRRGLAGAGRGRDARGHPGRRGTLRIQGGRGRHLADSHRTTPPPRR